MASLSVNLKRPWFGPDGAQRFPTGNPHSVSADWEKLLPSTAEVLATAAPMGEDDGDDEPKQAPKTPLKK